MPRVLWAVLVASCSYNSSVVPCGSVVCPSSRVCAPAEERCVFPDQVDACIGADEGAACSAQGVTAGLCHLGVCISSGCGNGVIEPGERCDDANRFSLDGCSSDCTSDERCGNAIVDLALGESCDCGDGSVETPASCAGANSSAAGASCRLDCTPATCGDGILDPGEWCDDGNHVPGDGCRADCAGRFTLMTSGTLKTLNAVWASGPSDAFAAGDERILHYNGVNWSSMALPGPGQYREICGTSSTNVYAVTNSGRLDRYDGATWTTMTVPTDLRPRHLACTASTLVVGGSDTQSQISAIAFWDGAQWTMLPAPATTTGRVEDIWAASSADVYVIMVDTSSGEVLMRRYDGASWQDVDAGSTYPYAVWGTSSSDVYMFYPVLRYDGTAWIQDPGSDEGSPQSFGGVAGDVVMIGSAGTQGFAARFDGSAWSLMPLPPTSTLFAIAGYESGRAFVVGAAGTILY